MNASTRTSLLTALAALALCGPAFAQAAAPDPVLTAPNNSAGTSSDGPEMNMRAPVRGSINVPSRTDSAASAFDKLHGSRQGYVTRADVAVLPESINFELADRNHDGHLDAEEFQQTWNEQGTGGQ